MKYFIDTEFIEGPQIRKFAGITVGKTKPTIDLISLAIVAEDGREYYAISKDFNLDEAWNRFEMKKAYPDETEDGSYSIRVHWIRENVLRPIWKELSDRYNEEDVFFHTDFYFNWKDLKFLIGYYGKTNQQIAEEVNDFINSEPVEIEGNPNGAQWLSAKSKRALRKGFIEPSFYGYYADYDWVAFCWLFGKMIDLPEGFPKYCRDLKQMLEDSWSLTFEAVGYAQSKYRQVKSYPNVGEMQDIFHDPEIKSHPDYPKQTNEHNALADARWNKQLYEFITKL